MYHRVIDLTTDPQLLCVAPANFQQHLEVLARNYHPLSLTELATALRSGNLPNRSVCVTFDDGYADNLENAAPLLTRYGVPATVFVTSGVLGQQREFWWDELERIVLQPGCLPDPLELCISERSFRWELGAAARYTAEEAARGLDWHVEQPDDPGPRQRLYRTLYALLQPLDVAARDRVVCELRRVAGLSPEGRKTHLSLTEEELKRLGTEESIEIGAHTVTHPLLATLPIEEQRAEIARSKACLERILGRAVTTFAYPHGSFEADTMSLLRSSQFTCACTSDPRPVWPGDELLCLPRLVVRNWDGDLFARAIREWMRG